MTKRTDAARAKAARWRQTQWDKIRQSAEEVKSVVAAPQPTTWAKLPPEKFAVKVNKMLQGEE